jgi:ribokinase
VRCAVVGHVEWVEFVRVPRMPAAGEIAHGGASWQEAAGGGAVMARQIARLNGQCEFFTALGDDDLGRRSQRRLAELGVDVHAVRFGESRRGWVHIDDAGERTITTLGAKLLPRGPLPLKGYDAVFFVSGEVEALQSARTARFLAATARELPTLKAAEVRLDLLTASARDPGERIDDKLEVATVVLTEGPAGGTANGERYAAAPLPGPVVDTYGAGDSFGAALCFALARGDDLHAALDLASRAGAAVVTGAGPYATQLALPE